MKTHNGLKDLMREINLPTYTHRNFMRGPLDGLRLFMESSMYQFTFKKDIYELNTRTGNLELAER